MTAYKDCTVKLTVKETTVINGILKFTHRKDSQGNWEPQFYSTRLGTGVRWFEKNTEGYLNEFSELAERKIEEFKKAVNLEELEAAHKSLVEELAKAQKAYQALSEEDKTEEELEKTKAAAKAADESSVAIQEAVDKANEMYNTDEELKAADSETEHEVKLSATTVEAIVYAFNNREFVAGDLWVLDILAKIQEAGTVA